MFPQVCVSSFPETRFLIHGLSSARCQQHLIIFSTQEQRLAGSSYYQYTSQKYSLCQGRGETVLGEIVGWGEELPKLAPVPPLHKKMEEYKVSKKILEQEPTQATWKASVKEPASLINRGNPRQNNPPRHQLAAGMWPLTRHKIPCSLRKC